VTSFSRLIVYAAAVTLAQVPAQPPPQQPQPPLPRFRAATNLVRVDVYATKEGVAVQDLTADDFEVFEDDASQKIDSFEHIVVRGGGPEAERGEPNTVAAANELAADPRRRVFVLYLDIEHVNADGSHAIKEPLIDLLSRIMGPDDLVAIMTPRMNPSHLTFGRRTKVIEEGLRTNWTWGRRDTILLDEREKLYAACFQPLHDGNESPSALAWELIRRRRERLALESMQGLIRHMGAMREGRTAVIAVTPGWVMYGRNQGLLGQRNNMDNSQADRIPGSPPPVGVGPRGTLTTRINPGDGVNDRTECDRDRMDLAMVDHRTAFRELFGEANRANVSFYPIDPRGLAAVDASIGPEKPPSPIQDRANLAERQESLRTIADNTDGVALLLNNDLKTALRRVADDLTSYYLLGYYSTNGTLDGKFRSIKVRSKRPGVTVRSRRGYNAATADEVAKARTAAETGVPEAKAALARAIGALETDARAAGRKTARAAGDPTMFHRGPSTGNQLQPADSRIFPRSERIRLEIEAVAGAPVWTGVVLDRNGAKTAVPVAVSERTDATSGQRWLVADITLAPLGPGDYVVELSTAKATVTHKSLVAIRVTQ
jgi:VWFA-related protein